VSVAEPALEAQYTTLDRRVWRHEGRSQIRRQIGAACDAQMGVLAGRRDDLEQHDLAGVRPLQLVPLLHGSRGDRFLVVKRMDIETKRRITMPDVGLTLSVEPLSPNYKVVIKYSVEVDGLSVYTETYDSAQLRKELESDEAKVQEIWFRRITCVIGCRHRRRFSACVTPCLLNGEICNEGHKA
jgi:hypothetical protein